ncbi:hypothetical protein C8A03DRAFT_14012, partial [Achaetomium macrosporum]
PLEAFLPIDPRRDRDNSKRSVQHFLRIQLPADIRGWIRSVEGSYGAGFTWLCASTTMGYAHHEALFDSSPFKKGMYLNRATGQWRPARLDRSLLPSCPVVVPKDAYHFVLPFYDPSSGFATRLAQRDINLIDEDAHTAALIYLCGRVRLGNRQCLCCQKRRIGTTTPGDPIPVCVSAAPYFHGICANCFAKGGTMLERLQRCSVSKAVDKKDWVKLNRLEAPGLIGGPSPLVGGSIEEVAFAENLFWKKGLPPGHGSSPNTPATRGPRLSGPRSG